MYQTSKNIIWKMIEQFGINVTTTTTTTYRCKNRWDLREIKKNIRDVKKCQKRVNFIFRGSILDEFLIQLQNP